MITTLECSSCHAGYYCLHGGLYVCTNPACDHEVTLQDIQPEVGESVILHWGLLAVRQDAEI